ncbi:MAG: ABC transporter ATP-binding protein [Clostridiales bacterium]|nr:ABC transporter ATP-binding protein [Clostridiales bacterium]
MVKIEKLYKSYKFHRVLNGLDMHVKEGEVYGFIGENGSGKTTTMNILCNIIKKDTGLITLNGGKEYRIGYLPESPMLFTYMNAHQYLDYIGACCEYPGDIKARNEELLKLVNLTDAANRKIKGYSRGMNQRLGLASAIYIDPDIIILDEPTSALDPQGRAEVIKIIQHLKSAGKTVILSTHILTDVERVADTVGILHGGVLVEEESLETLLSRHSNNSISITPMANNEQIHNKILQIDFGNVYTDGKGSYNVLVEDLDKDGVKLQNYLKENDINLSGYYVNKVTLEDIYLKAVSNNAN